jgi:1,4-dihydroxy-2-naphthoate polyprenyltransferase
MADEPQPSRRRIWWHAARPATLLLSVAPVVAGTALAVHDGAHRPLAAVAALVVAVAMQLGVNFANDYSDFVRGADTPRRVGPVRAASSGVVAPSHVRWAAIGSFGLAAAMGVALSLTTDWRLLIAGVLAVAAGWLYTGGPLPYGYLGLGEVFVFVFFGLLATVGTTYVQELRAPASAWLIGAALGCLTTAVLDINNLRDLETDAEAGKRTLTVRIGRERTRWLVAGLYVAACVLPIVAVAFAGAPTLAVLPLATAPFLLAVHRATASSDPPALISALKRSAQLDLAFALLWALGVLLP